jgi:two-component system response regulator
MGRGPALLLVEDDGNDVALALRALEHAGIDVHVDVARDGQEALDFLRLDSGDAAHSAVSPRPPDVIFLDLKMPKVDGWEVLREIRSSERTREIPVVVLSVSDRPEDIQRCYRLGANSYLVKRFDPRQPGSYLVDAARYWIELNRTPPRRREEGR